MSSLMIHEVYGGGGTPGGQQVTAGIVPTYKNDYIVIHNTSGTAISLVGVSIQIQNGPGLGAWTVVDLSSAASPTVPAYGYFLVQMGTVDSSLGGASLPTPDFIASLAAGQEMGFQNGKVALTTGITPLNTAGTAAVGTLTSAASVIDLVGYGNGNVAEGTRAVAPGTVTSIVRNATSGWDTNSNSGDFASATPSPKNSATAADDTGAPTVTSAATANLDENTQSVQSVTATDPENLTLTYSVLNPSSFATAGADGALFNIDTSTGALTFAAGPNFEAGTGHGANANEYLVTVRVTDAGGASRDQLVTVTVNDVNEAPTAIGLSATTLAENNAVGAVVATLSTTDPDGAGSGFAGPFTYALVAGTGDTDNGSFTITGDQLTINNAADFEAKASYAILIRVTDANGLTFDQQKIITITDANEFAVTTPTDTDAAMNAIDENATGIVGITANATDADGTNNTVTYSLVTDSGGLTAYAGPFSINAGTGVVSLSSALDRETVGASVTLFVKASSTDGSSAVGSFNVAINDLNEPVSAPIDSNAAANAIFENTIGLVGITASATDADATNNAVTYSLVADLSGLTAYAGPFAINSATGAVSLTTALDYENTGPTKAIFVKATSADGSSAVSQFTVTIKNQSPETKIGTAENNGLVGGSDSDKLFGLGGDDTMLGLGGNDVLTGGFGRDTMAGGAGGDTFDFNFALETGKTAATRDRITDFDATDIIDLRDIDANGLAAGSTAFSFLAAQGAAFTGVRGQLHWFQVNPAGTTGDRTFIEGDVNGDKIADFQIELFGLKNLNQGDFLL